MIQIIVQLLSHVRLFATPWTAACQAFLSSNNFQNLFKLMSIKSVMQSNNLILCLPLHTIKSYKKYSSIIPLKFKVFIFFSIIKHFSVNRIKISSQQQWENFQVSFIKFWDIINSLDKVKWSEVAQSCPTLCDPIDCSLAGSSVHGIFQAIVLEWIAISFSRGSSQPKAWTRVSRIVDRRFTVWATREVLAAVNMVLRIWDLFIYVWINNTSKGKIHKFCKGCSINVSLLCISLTAQFPFVEGLVFWVGSYGSSPRATLSSWSCGFGPKHSFSNSRPSFCFFTGFSLDSAHTGGFWTQTTIATPRHRW